jgi:hypothetical protein
MILRNNLNSLDDDVTSFVKTHPRSNFSFRLDCQLLLDWLREANVAPPTPLSANEVKAESLI